MAIGISGAGFFCCCSVDFFRRFEEVLSYRIRQSAQRTLISIIHIPKMVEQEIDSLLIPAGAFLEPQGLPELSVGTNDPRT